MSIQSEISRISGNISGTYSALEELGAEMPSTQNSDNLEATARTVQIPDTSTLMTKENPTGTGAFSMNRKSGSTVGDYSTAEGSGCTASGLGAHAEGENTVASGAVSHAEGRNCKASGWGSHAEGSGTDASSIYQHVQGKYNVIDTSSLYAHIVGNGTDDTSRSNAHTLDWNGLGWFAGGLKVGGTGQTDATAKTVPAVDSSGALDVQAAAKSDGQAPGSMLLRNSQLVSAETSPTVNGEICWQYG